MSSSFALGCRRRSHSASSPSPSPVPVPPCRPPHKRAHSSHRDTPHRCHLDIWRSGKRPRTDPSATRSSTPPSADSHTTSSSSSPPQTPLFPASPADFLLFPRHPLFSDDLFARNSRSPSSAAPLLHGDACESTQSDLARLRSAAFSELHRSVQENGEGFVKRMRDFEDSRSRSAQHSRARGTERRRRKRYSPSLPTTRAFGKSTISDDDDDDVVLIFSSSFGAEPTHSRQKRSSSLGAMDDSDLQLYGDTNSFGRHSPTSSIFHPLPFAHYTSHVHPDTTNQPMKFNTSFDFVNTLHTNSFKSASSCSSDSLASLTDGTNSPSSPPMVSPPQSPIHSPAGATLPSASSAEKAIAAIALAMANGAGGLGDYEAARALNVSSGDESLAGELWH